MGTVRCHIERKRETRVCVEAARQNRATAPRCCEEESSENSGVWERRAHESSGGSWQLAEAAGSRRQQRRRTAEAGRAIKAVRACNAARARQQLSGGQHAHCQETTSRLGWSGGGNLLKRCRSAASSSLATKTAQAARVDGGTCNAARGGQKNGTRGGVDL